MQVYPDAIAFGGQLDAMRGYLSTIGALSFLLLLAFAYDAIVSTPSTFWALMSVLLCFISWTMMRIDFNGFRYTPVLLNRGAGKVHVFEEVGFDVLAFWKLWGGHKYVIHTYEGHGRDEGKMYTHPLQAYVS